MALKYQLANEKTEEIQIEDPIYGKITISYPYSKIIFTKEMKRLEDIHQNGFSEYDYPGLKNNERLSHSIGAFYNMNQIINQLEDKLKHYGIEISQDDKDIALCSMLLHDIGHGPNSHSFELTTHYSHEKRTVDILLGDTEIHKILVEIFGEKKTKKIASFISEIGDEEITESKNSFTKLIKSLVSHQLDADRLDYLQRDSYHAGIPTAIRTENIVNSLGVIVNVNKEYELVVDKKGVTSIETILLERFQKYRDIYYTDSSIIMDTIFAKIVDRYKKYKDSIKGEIPEQFKKIAENPESIDLQDFLNMTDTPITNALEIIKETSEDEILAYLCDKNNIKDYNTFETNLDDVYVRNRLYDIFKTKKVYDTISTFQTNYKTRLYKRDEGLKVNYGNRVIDLSEATNLIRPQEMLQKNNLIFNPEILRLELGLSKEEFKKYRKELEKMIQELNKKPEEFELKYIIPNNLKEELSRENLIKEFLNNEFSIIEQSQKENNDNYYDTKEASLLNKGGSLRIRTVTKDGIVKYKATYKIPIEKGEVYSSRKEIEETLKLGTLEELKQVMKSKNIDIDLASIVDIPIINSKTNRHDIVFEKEGVQVCVSFDETTYKNYALKGVETQDSMIEIEAIGDVTDRICLNEIHEFISKRFPELETNKQSKYERGVKRTRTLYKSELEKQGIIAKEDESQEK